MIRAEAAGLRAPGFGSAAQDIALPLDGARGDFAVLMRQVQNEVRDFIANGGGEQAQGSQLLFEQALSASADRPADDTEVSGSTERQQAFLATIKPGLGEAAARLGVAEEVLAAHAALESGWGQKPIRQSSGQDTNNLFGIKATGGWQGDSAEVMTTEFAGTLALKKRERFRSYADAGEAIRDFSQLLASNPRYRSALNTGSDARAYAEALVRGGYATDPGYADKLVRIASRLQSGD